MCSSVCVCKHISYLPIRWKHLATNASTGTCQQQISGSAEVFPAIEIYQVYPPPLTCVMYIASCYLQCVLLLYWNLLHKTPVNCCNISGTLVLKSQALEPAYNFCICVLRCTLHFFTSLHPGYIIINAHKHGTFNFWENENGRCHGRYCRLMYWLCFW